MKNGPREPLTDPKDGKPGLRIETAAGVTARDMISQHLGAFGISIRRDALASRTAAAAYIDGLAGVLALTIAGGHGSRDEVLDETIKQLRNAVERDLKHLKHT